MEYPHLVVSPVISQAIVVFCPIPDIWKADVGLAREFLRGHDGFQNVSSGWEW